MVAPMVLPPPLVDATFTFVFKTRFLLLVALIDLVVLIRLRRHDTFSEENGIASAMVF